MSHEFRKEIEFEEKLSRRERMLLSYLYNANKILEPTVDMAFGARYPLAEDILGVKPNVVKNVLERLSSEGYLTRELYIVILKCPDCSGYWLILRLHCPYCNSSKLRRGEAIKHYECGHIGFKSDFIKNNEYVCPRCNKKLERLGTEYKLIGTWYTCLDCGERFGEPKEMLYCNDCDKEFERDQLILEGLLRYRLNEKSLTGVLLEFDLNKIVEMFRDKWDVLIPAKIEGTSGVTHVFSGVMLSKGILRKKVLFDIEYDVEAVGPDAVMRFFAKSVDVKSDLFILIGIPRFASDAKELAKAYKVNVLEGEKIENVLESLNKLLKSTLEAGR